MCSSTCLGSGRWQPFLKLKENATIYVLCIWAFFYFYFFFSLLPSFLFSFVWSTQPCKETTPVCTDRGNATDCLGEINFRIVARTEEIGGRNPSWLDDEVAVVWVIELRAQHLGCGWYSFLPSLFEWKMSSKHTNMIFILKNNELEA